LSEKIVGGGNKKGGCDSGRGVLYICILESADKSVVIVIHRCPDLCCQC